MYLSRRILHAAARSVAAPKGPYPAATSAWHRCDHLARLRAKSQDKFQSPAAFACPQNGTPGARACPPSVEREGTVRRRLKSCAGVCRTLHSELLFRSAPLLVLPRLPCWYLTR